MYDALVLSRIDTWCVQQPIEHILENKSLARGPQRSLGDFLLAEFNVRTSIHV
jgi:hypothetical protein